MVKTKAKLTDAVLLVDANSVDNAEKALVNIIKLFENPKTAATVIAGILQVSVTNSGVETKYKDTFKKALKSKL